MSASPIILAIETSQRLGGVAVRDGGGQLHESPMQPGRRHDDDLLPTIDRLLQRVGLGPADLNVVGVSVGPGGFTGLRIGIATAKMLGEVLGVALVAVPTAMVVAGSLQARWQVDDQRVLVTLAAKREGFWATALTRGESRWRLEGPGALMEPGPLELSGIDAVVADAYLPNWARARCEADVVPIVAPVFSAAAACVATEQLLDRGVTTNPLDLHPIYPRPPEAVRISHQHRREGA